MAEEVLLTQEGFDKLEAERDELVSVRRKEVSERLKEAISYGDLSENAEYDAAKNEQAELEERIHKLETMIRNAKIIDEKSVKGDKVNVGLKVKVKDEKTKENLEFIIVGSTEVDPFAEPAKISNDSLVGSHLLGKKKGETVEIPVPDGILHYTIESIAKPGKKTTATKAKAESKAKTKTATKAKSETKAKTDSKAKAGSKSKAKAKS